MSQFQFNAAAVPPAVPFEPVPADWYLAKVIESEVSPTKDGSGRYLRLVCELLAGPYKGRKVFTNHNTVNANQQAVDIGMREISALCHAIGVLQIADTTHLHDRPFECKISYRPADGNYEAANEIRGYRAVGSGKKPAGNGEGGSVPAAAGAGVSAPSFGPPGASGGVPAAPSFAPPGTAPAPSFGPPGAPSFPPPATNAAPPAMAPPGFAPPPAAAPPAFTPPPVPSAPAAPVAPPAFPPEGWTAHPSAPGYFYRGQEVKSETELRAMVAPPAPPAMPQFAPPPAAGGMPAPSWAQR